MYLIVNFKNFGSYIGNKTGTNEMYIDLVIPFQDVKNYDVSMDQNEPMEGNQSYLVVNSMTKALMTWMKNTNDVPTEDFSWVI